MADLIIRPYCSEDLDTVAHIHETSFLRQRHSRIWIAANAKGFPRLRIYVASVNGVVCGYALWSELSGFRQDAVVELDQIAVEQLARSKGIGAELIAQSLTAIARELESRGSRLDKVLIGTRTDNRAQELYRKVLGAQAEGIIHDLFSSDEVFMLSRAPLNAISAWRAQGNTDQAKTVNL